LKHFVVQVNAILLRPTGFMIYLELITEVLVSLPIFFS